MPAECGASWQVLQNQSFHLATSIGNVLGQGPCEADTSASEELRRVTVVTLRDRDSVYGMETSP